MAGHPRDDFAVVAVECEDGQYDLALRRVISSPSLHGCLFAASTGSPEFGCGIGRSGRLDAVEEREDYPRERETRSFNGRRASTGAYTLAALS